MRTYRQPRHPGRTDSCSIQDYTDPQHISLGTQTAAASRITLTLNTSAWTHRQLQQSGTHRPSTHRLGHTDSCSCRSTQTPTLVGVVQPQQQRRHRRLATPAGPDQRQGAAGRQAEVKAAEHGRVRACRVREVHVPQLELRAEAGG